MSEILIPLIGGILIGLASCIVLLFLGKITGISGIIAKGIFNRSEDDYIWRITFILGLIYGGLLMKFLRPEYFDFELESNIPLVVIAGILVGFGTRLGSGCTSGHGVCGIGRRSKRSIVATITFISCGVLTVLIKGMIV